jgi:hypothetical protein
MSTSTSTGTGDLAMSGVVAGWQPLASGLTDGDQIYYTVVDPVTGDWETGEGTYSADTLRRDTVRDSSNGKALVDFAANAKNVFVDATAQTFIDITSGPPPDPGSGYMPLTGGTFTGEVDFAAAAVFHGPLISGNNDFFLSASPGYSLLLGAGDGSNSQRIQWSGNYLKLGDDFVIQRTGQSGRAYFGWFNEMVLLDFTSADTIHFRTSDDSDDATLIFRTQPSGTSDNSGATTAFVAAALAAALPAGVVVEFAGDAAPAGWQFQAPGKIVKL